MIGLGITAMICFTLIVIAYFEYKKETASKGEEDKEE